MLRNYQQDAHDKIIDWVRKSTDPIVIDAATGSGKSHIIAAVAQTILNMTGKRVLCLAPSAELVIQNREKYLATGNPASIFSASAGDKCLRHPVVFGTPGTVKNRITKFGDRFGMIICDEAHAITPTVKSIIDSLKSVNPNIRVVGMSATPYRMGSGYIYAMNPDLTSVPDHQTKNPYFKACVYRIHARELIAQKYLTPPVIGEINSTGYKTAHMQTNKMGRFAADEIEMAFVGQGRKTSGIIWDIVTQSKDRDGVMIFAATIAHAHECMASLPPDLSAMVTSKTPGAERKKIIAGFKARRIKYIVNVSVLTTGFDAEHVDVIAMLRATESVGLLQQIIGRGLRLRDGKQDCLVLDYAENIERHCPDGDVFAPEIRVTVSDKEAVIMTVICPECHSKNEVSARPNEDSFGYSDDGYFLDLDRNKISGDFGWIPSHYGRRCQAFALSEINRGEYEQCGYRWTGKDCPVCEADNDIAARHCRICRAEIVNPNDKLRFDFKAMKRDPTQMQTDVVLSSTITETVSRAGNEMYRAFWETPYRKFTTYVQKNPKYPKGQKSLRDFEEAMKDEKTPRTITYSKGTTNEFFTIHRYNQQEDEDISA